VHKVSLLPRTGRTGHTHKKKRKDE